MTLTLLLLGATVAMAAVYAVATQSSETVNPILSDESLVGLADPAAETLSGNCATPPPALGDWQMTLVAGLRDAEMLLDSLEARGIQERELMILGESSFAVRWK